MFKNYFLVLLVSISFQTLTQSQTPCTSGTAGNYPCKDYDLMSRVPISTMATNNADGSDIWGWTDPLDGKEYAIVCTSNSTAFVDITDPVNPVFLGRIETANGRTNVWRDAKVYNNHVFIVADGVSNHGMQVFDLTILRNGVDADLTYNGSQVLRYRGDGGSGDLVIGSCHNIVINEFEGIAYLVGCSSANGGGPIFVDITNPANPTVLGDYTNGGYSHDAQVVTYTGPDKDYYDPANGITGRQIYIGSNGNTDKVVILDVTNKNNIIEINDFDYPQTAYAHQGWFTEDQRYFLLGDELDEQNFGVNTRTFIFDFSDLDGNFNLDSDNNNLPDLIKIYEGTTRAIDHNGYVKGGNYFLANYRAGLRVLDVRTLLSANNSNAEIGFFDTYPGSNSGNFNGAWSVYPYFESGNIIISDIERGLFVVRKSNTLSTPEFELQTNFTISPNPTNSFSTVKTDNGKIYSIEIHSILGQKIYSKNNINTQKFVLPTKNYTPGVYLIKINNLVTKKLVVK